MKAASGRRVIDTQERIERETSERVDLRTDVLALVVGRVAEVAVEGEIWP